jgi:hypothetical protein
LTRAVNAYARRLQAAGPGTVGFFYFSGHGASDGGPTISFPSMLRPSKLANFGTNHCGSPKSRAS